MSLSKIQANMTENVLRTDITDQVLSPDTVIKNAGLADNFPIGMVVLFVNDTQFGDSTSGWLACDGGAVLKSSYPDLYLEIGGSFGQTSTTFNLPGITTPTEIVSMSLGGGYGIRAKNRTKV
jgi:microcystin-dependent protein